MAGIFKEMQSLMNFTYNLVESVDGFYGTMVKFYPNNFVLYHNDSLQPDVSIVNLPLMDFDCKTIIIII